jgi:hypothetical protein
MRTLLENIQDVAIEVGLPIPSAIVVSTDATTLQLYAYMNRLGEMLASEHDWQVLAKSTAFTAFATSYAVDMVSGSNIITMPSTSGLAVGFSVSADGLAANSIITSIAPDVSVTLSNAATKTQSATAAFSQMDYALPPDFHHIVIDTEYDVINRWGIRAETPQGWHAIRTNYTANSTVAHFRLLQDKFSVYPPQPNGKVFNLEYQSSYYAVDNTGLTKPRFTLDTDTCLFPDRLMVMGCKLKFWQQKGFDSTIMADDFGRELSKYKGQQSSSQSIRTAGYYGDGLPSMNVPDGTIGR